MNLRLILVILAVLAAGVAGLIYLGYSISPEQRPMEVEVGDAP